MSTALEDLIVKLYKKGKSEEQIYTHLSESEKISEVFALEDIYGVLAKYRTGIAMAGHDTGKKVFTRVWGAIVFLIGLILLTIIIVSGSFPSPGIALATFIMLFAGVTLMFKPQNRFDKLD